MISNLQKSRGHSKIAKNVEISVSDIDKNLLGSSLASIECIAFEERRSSLLCQKNLHGKGSNSSSSSKEDCMKSITSTKSSLSHLLANEKSVHELLEIVGGVGANEVLSSNNEEITPSRVAKRKYKRKKDL